MNVKREIPIQRYKVMIKSVLVRVWQLPDHGEPPRHGGAPERGDAVPHPLLLHLQLGVTAVSPWGQYQVLFRAILPLFYIFYCCLAFAIKRI